MDMKKAFLYFLVFSIMVSIIPASYAASLESELFEAISAENTTRVADLIKQGANVNAKDTNGQTPVMKAAFRKNTAIVKLLVNNGANVNAQDKDGYSVLVIAMTLPASESVEIASFLIKKGASVNAKNEGEWTPLMEVSKGWGYFSVDFEKKDYFSKPAAEIAKLLINNGADVNAKYQTGQTALMVASEKGQLEVVKVLLENGAKVDSTDAQGYNSMIYAMGGLYQRMQKYDTEAEPKFVNRAKEIIQYLIDKGAPVNTQFEGGMTPLMLASAWGEVEIAKLLVKNGANLDAKDIEGNGVLIHVMNYVHNSPQPANKKTAVAIKLLKLFIDKGVDVNARGTDNLTVIMGAATLGELDIARFLIDKGADVNAKLAHNDMTVLMWAGDRGHTDVVKLLIDHGANVNALDIYGDTALMSSIRLDENNHNLDTIKLLINKGTNLDIKNKYGKTALDIAIQRNQIEVVDLLKKAGTQR